MLPADFPYYFCGLPFRAHQVGRKLRRLIGRGDIRQLIPGVYVDTRVPDCSELRAEALSLVVPADAVIHGDAAAWLHGIRRPDLWGSYPALELTFGAFLCQHPKLPRRW